MGRSVLFTLDINKYSPEITELTFPLMRYYARKIGAQFHIIKEREYPEWPIPVEKFQVGRLAKEMNAEWAIFFDADALIHPETPDWTQYLPRDTVAHNGSDFSGVRWRPNPWFMRDGRNIGSCNWCSIASDWTYDDFWHMDKDLSPSDVLDEIYPTVTELNTGFIDAEHLVDDYLMSCNVARFGLKYMNLLDVQKQIGLDGSGFHWHQYVLTKEEKLRQMRTVLWGDPGKTVNGEKDKGWDLPASILPR